MSKPPFIIPNRKGTELWPTSGHIPTKMTVNVDPRGVTSNELVVAQSVADAKIKECAGQIKQFYLRNRSASDLGIVQHSAQRMPVAPGLEARYVRNSSLESISVNASAKGIVDQLIDEGWLRQYLYDVFVVIVYDWDGGGGYDLDTLTRYSVPERGYYLGYAALPDGAGKSTPRKGTSPFDTDSGKTVTYKNEKVMFWGSGDDTSDYGAEFVYCDCEPIFKDGNFFVEIELNGNWFGEKHSGRVRVTIDVYQKNWKTIKSDFTGTGKSLAEITAYFDSQGARRLSRTTVDTVVSVYNYSLNLVQRIGTLRVTILPVLCYPSGVPKEDQVATLAAFDSQSDTFNPQTR